MAMSVASNSVELRVSQRGQTMLDLSRLNRSISDSHWFLDISIMKPVSAKGAMVETCRNIFQCSSKLSCDGLLGLFVSSESSVIMAAVTVGV